jgi:tRNA pseudouridine32 synthase/23S rRNA pseudouridine746 synthase
MRCASGCRAPALAHRLDRDTSGCLVLGRHRKALASLGLLFKHGKVGKAYWAVVEGGPDADEGRIEFPLGRRDASRGWWMKPDARGQPAVTTWKVLGRATCDREHGESRRVPSSLAGAEHGGGWIASFEPGTHPPAQPSPEKGEGARGAGGAATVSRRLTWLALELLTGRTHQLRVHCAEKGFPIVGDAIYGSAPRSGGVGLHLHAREVVVPLAKNRPPIRVTAPVPPHMRELLAACGWVAETIS